MISEDDEEVSPREEMRLYTINEVSSSVSDNRFSNVTSLAKNRETTT